MERRRDRSSQAQFPENLVDPLVAGMFRALERRVWRVVLWVFEKAGLKR